MCSVCNQRPRQRLVSTSGTRATPKPSGAVGGELLSPGATGGAPQRLRDGDAAGCRTPRASPRRCHTPATRADPQATAEWHAAPARVSRRAARPGCNGGSSCACRAAGWAAMSAHDVPVATLARQVVVRARAIGDVVDGQPCGPARLATARAGEEDENRACAWCEHYIASRWKCTEMTKKKPAGCRRPGLATWVFSVRCRMGAVAQVCASPVRK